MFSKLKPNNPIPIAVEKIDEFLNVKYDIITDTAELNELENKVKSKIKTKKQEFELNEQLLILNLCLVDKNSIPITEKSKLIILIGEIIEDNLFKVPSSDSNTYDKISKGILRKGSVSKMIEIIDMVLIKIEGFNLKFTNQTLKKHKATLKNEQKHT